MKLVMRTGVEAKGHGVAVPARLSRCISSTYMKVAILS